MNTSTPSQKPQHSATMLAWLRQRELDGADAAFDKAERYLRDERIKEGKEKAPPAQQETPAS